MKKIQDIARRMRTSTGEQLNGIKEIAAAAASVNASAQDFVKTSDLLRDAMASLTASSHRISETIQSDVQ